MIKDAAQMIKENYNKLGALTDSQFIAAKARTCSKKLIHAERVIGVQLMDGLLNNFITIDKIEVGATVKIKATVRHMSGDVEKTGVITLDNVKDIQVDQQTGMWIIENDRYIVTTLNCQKEMADLEAVIRDDNWVNMHSLGELIGDETLLSDFKLVRDYEDNRDLEWEDLGFVEDISKPNLLF